MPQPASDHPDGTGSNAFVYYRYDPSVVAAGIFILCFLATTALHLFQASMRRTGYFIPLVVGGFFEFLGYIGRAIAHDDQQTESIYIMQQLLLLLAPALFAASIYMTLGRMILFTDGEKMAPIRSSRLTKIFVCGDVLSFLIQSGGGGLMTSAKSMTLGKNLIILGLILQVLFFGIFVVTGSIFHYRLVRSPTSASLEANWQKYMFTLYAASILILIRSVFRVIEFSGGNDGVIMRNELFLYVFDALLMLGVMITFNVVHPGEIIGGRGSGSLRGQVVMLSGRQRESDSEANNERK